MFLHCYCCPIARVGHVCSVCSDRIDRNSPEARLTTKSIAKVVCVPD